MKETKKHLVSLSEKIGLIFLLIGVGLMGLVGYILIASIWAIPFVIVAFVVKYLFF